MSPSLFYPKLITCFKEGFNRRQLIRDLFAGSIVAVVALPLAIAFAIASGVKPEQGLFTAIIAGFIISACGGSRVQIGGPTGAFIIIVYDIVQRFGYQGLAVATMMAGVMLILMGLLRLGAVISFIPYPVTVGFTSGIALIILLGQIRDFFGLTMGELPANFFEKLSAYGSSIGSVSFPSLVVGTLTVVIILLWPRVTHRIPGSLIALVVTTSMVALLDIPVATIGSRFGEIPVTLPRPAMPALPDLHMLTQLISPAVTIAILAGIESLLSAVVADGMTERRHHSNTELIAQGLANIASPMFGGIPATGAIARTATNVKNGGSTPVAGIVHALVLLLILVFFGRWAALIPLPTLAGILLVVAIHMSEVRLFSRLLRGPKGDAVVLLTTFGLTVVIDLTVALQVGMVLAAFLFMERMAAATRIGFITGDLREGHDPQEEDPNSLKVRDVPEGVEVFEINGPFFFGAANKFKNALGAIGDPPRVLILRMRHALTLDATALQALESMHERSRRNGTRLILSGVHAQPLTVMERTGFLDAIGEENVFNHIDPALARAREIVENRG